MDSDGTRNPNAKILPRFTVWYPPARSSNGSLCGKPDLGRWTKGGVEWVPYVCGQEKKKKSKQGRFRRGQCRRDGDDDGGASESPFSRRVDAGRVDGLWSGGVGLEKRRRG